MVNDLLKGGDLRARHGCSSPPGNAASNAAEEVGAMVPLTKVKRKSRSNKWPRKKEISHVAIFCSLWPGEAGRTLLRPTERNRYDLTRHRTLQPTLFFRTPWARLRKLGCRLSGCTRPLRHAALHAGEVYAQVREVSCRVCLQRLLPMQRWTAEQL